MRRRLSIASAAVACVVFGGCSAEQVTSDTDRERAIAQLEDGFDMSRDEVTATAEGFCETVRSVNDLQGLADEYSAMPGFTPILGQSTEIMVRIGGCERDYFAIGGTFDNWDENPLRGLTESESETKPTTPLPIIGSGGPATLALDNGVTLSFEATCVIEEPTSPSTSSVQTRFGVYADDGTNRLEATVDYVGGPIGEVFEIRVFDVNSGGILWSSDSPLGQEFEVEGSEVSAVDEFFSPSLAPDAPPVRGRFTATC